VSIFNVFALCRATLAGVPPRLVRQDCTGSVILASRQPSLGEAQIPPLLTKYRQATPFALRIAVPPRFRLAEICFWIMPDSAGPAAGMWAGSHAADAD
jgi:hypothetical protein